MLKNKSESFKHSLANKLTLMRIRLEKFLMDYSDGRMKNKSDQAIQKQTIVLIQNTIAQIDNILC
jgi:hypothetical protein